MKHNVVVNLYPKSKSENYINLYENCTTQLFERLPKFGIKKTK